LLMSGGLETGENGAAQRPMTIEIYHRLTLSNSVQSTEIGRDFVFGGVRADHSGNPY
jgi:hypothetical protein